MSAEKNASVQIQLGLLYASPLNTYDTEDVDDLVESIRLNGLMQPLYVEGPHEDGRYEVLGGCRRLKAILRINEQAIAEGSPSVYSDVPCIVTPIVEDAAMKQIIIETLNLTAREMNMAERYAHYFQLAESIESLNPTLLQTEKIEIFRRYVTGSSRYVRAVFYLNKSPKIRDLAGREGVGIINASYAVALPEDQQAEWIRRVSAGERASLVYNFITRKKLNLLSNPMLCQLVEENKVSIADAEWAATNLTSQLQQIWYQKIMAGEKPDEVCEVCKELKKKQEHESKVMQKETSVAEFSATESPKGENENTQRFSIPLSEIENAQKPHESVLVESVKTENVSAGGNFTLPPTYVAHATGSREEYHHTTDETFTEKNQESAVQPGSTENTDFSPDQISEALSMLSFNSDDRSNGDMDLECDITGSTEGLLFSEEDDSEASFDDMMASYGMIDSSGRTAGLFRSEKKNGKESDALTNEDVQRMIGSIRRMSTQLHEFFETHSRYEEANIFATLIDNLGEIDV